MDDNLDKEALQADGLRKNYGSAEVLRDVHLILNPGEIHALIGHNGAGKSTLLKILSGSERAGSGHIRVGDREVVLTSPQDAAKAGIAIVYQELRVIPQLTIAQNIFLGDERQRHGLLSRKEMNSDAVRLLAEFGLTEPPDMLVTGLSHAKRQLVEILGALRKNARYLLLDEPTSSLEGEQVNRLLATIRKLASERGTAVLLVDHKINEVLSVSDVITVLVDGTVRFSVPTSEAREETLIEAIAGQSVRSRTSEIEAADEDGKPSLTSLRGDSRDTVLSVRDVVTKHLRGVTLDVHKGEVVGIYGLTGSGRSRFCKTMVGEERVISGSIRLYGKPYYVRSPSVSRRLGVLYLPEDRKELGLIPQMTAVRNASLAVLDYFRSGPLLNWGEIERVARRQLNDLSVRGNLDGPVSRLSGGNQQKVLFSRILLQHANLLIFDEPTTGVDIGVKNELLALIRRVAREKECGVLVVSSEEEEILEVSDRVAIFRSGQCDGVLFKKPHLDINGLRTLAWQN